MKKAKIKKVIINILYVLICISISYNAVLIIKGNRVRKERDSAIHYYGWFDGQKALIKSAHENCEWNDSIAKVYYSNDSIAFTEFMDY